MMSYRKMVGGIAQEIVAREEILRKERELEEAREKLAQLRKAKYGNTTQKMAQMEIITSQMDGNQMICQSGSSQSVQQLQPGQSGYGECTGFHGDWNMNFINDQSLTNQEIRSI